MPKDLHKFVQIGESYNYEKYYSGHLKLGKNRIFAHGLAFCS